MTDRADAILSFMGKPWLANGKGPDAYDCWHLVVAVSRHLFGREVPAVAVPPAPTWSWMIRTIRDHPEREHWREVPSGAMHTIKAGDGAIVLMARSDRPAHIGIWLAREQYILHADPVFGVVCDSPLNLRTKGWTRQVFYEPAER